MDSPLSGRDDGQLIEIRTPKLDFYIKGEMRGLTKVTSDDFAIYQVQCEEEVALNILNVAQVETKVFYEQAIPQFFEQTSYQVIIEAKTDQKVRFDHDSMLIRQKVDALGSGKLLTGVINFGNEIGLTELRVLVDGKVYLHVTLEIYPMKLGYKTDYIRLREDVAQEMYNLTFDFMRTTYLGADLVQSNQPSLVEFYSILRSKLNEFLKAIDLITTKPHHELQSVEEMRRYSHGSKITSKGLQYLNKHPNQMQRQDNQFIPTKYLHIQKQITMDLYENQFVKYMISNIVYQLQNVAKQYQKLRREEDILLTSQIKETINELEKRIHGSFFSQISKLDQVRQFSMVMQMSSIYKQFYKLYLTLRMGLSIYGGLFQISNKNIAELYEYWCFIKLGSLLKEKHILIQTKHNQYNLEGLYTTLKKGRASVMSFKHSQTGEIFTLAYNKVEETPTVSQKPDNMLSLKKELNNQSYQYVIDAKYRLNYEKKEDGVLEVPKEGDINTMHRYRDAIVYKNKENRYERSVVGAIILFPGSQNEAYKDARFYKSIQQVNIGGLPFLPSNTSLVEAFLDELIGNMDEGKAKALYEIPIEEERESYVAEEVKLVYMERK